MRMNFIHSKVFIVEPMLGTLGTVIITMIVSQVTSTDKVNHSRHPMDPWYLSWSRTKKGMVLNVLGLLKLYRILTGSWLKNDQEKVICTICLLHTIELILIWWFMLNPCSVEVLMIPWIMVMLSIMQLQTVLTCNSSKTTKYSEPVRILNIACQIFLRLKYTGKHRW